ncbi:MAG: TIGR03089 family protein [Cellulomonas sp.]
MPPSTISDVLAALQREPGKPRLTWYGDGGERIELSGAVLENWVSKTANLLVEEFDAAPGVRVLVDLPPHWRTIVWAFATWRVGACVVLAADPSAPSSDVDVVVTDRPDQFGRSVPVVAVTLPALARTFGAGLPAGAIDAAAAVMTYGDVIGWAPPVDPAAPALVRAGAAVTHAQLIAWADEVTIPAGARTLVPTSANGSVAAGSVAEGSAADGTARALHAVLSGLSSGGSIVLVDPATSDALASDTPRRDRLVATERITATSPVR